MLLEEALEARNPRTAYFSAVFETLKAALTKPSHSL
jgi:hypothetical protein